MISLNDAAAAGITRIRQPNWAIPEDHILIDIADGKPGPWLHLFSPFNLRCNGRDPVNVQWSAWLPTPDPNLKCFVPYAGPMPEADEYKAAAARFEKLAQEAE